MGGRPNDDLAEENDLTVIADCRYSHDGTGLHRAVDPADQKVYTYTKFEPAYARTVFANFEQPDLKATFSTAVLVPGHWTVISNEPVAERTPAGERFVRWRFRQTPRLSTYLFAVAAGEYEVVATTHVTLGGQQGSVRLQRELRRRCDGALTSSPPSRQL